MDLCDFIFGTDAVWLQAVVYAQFNDIIHLEADITHTHRLSTVQCSRQVGIDLF